MQVKHLGREDLALSCPQRGLLGSFLHAKVCWSNGVVEEWSNDKALFKLKLGFWLFPTLQYSKTPVLQNCSLSILAKPFNSDLAQRTRFPRF